MTNNDVLRSLRYTFDFNDSKMISIFACAENEVTREQISQWLKKDDDPDYIKIPDLNFATFLNGLIVHLRGKKDGPQPRPENQLDNNLILKKIKIALNLKSQDLIDLINLAGLSISESELTAFFRKPGHKNYRKCQDQVLRKILKGLQLKHRP